LNFLMTNGEGEVGWASLGTARHGGTNPPQTTR
jgi:hypothetical protein